MLAAWSTTMNVYRAFWFSFFKIQLCSVVLISVLLHGNYIRFSFASSVSICVSLFLAPTFFASFFHYTFFSLPSIHITIIRLVTSVSNSKLSCLRASRAVCFVFYISIQYIGLECGMKREFFSFLFCSVLSPVVSLSCHFTPLLFKLALFTVVYNAFMRERLFYAMPSSTYSLLSKYGCAYRTQCVRYSPDGWSHSFSI